MIGDNYNSLLLIGIIKVASVAHTITCLNQSEGYN